MVRKSPTQAASVCQIRVGRTWLVDTATDQRPVWISLGRRAWTQPGSYQLLHSKCWLRGRLEPYRRRLARPRRRPGRPERAAAGVVSAGPPGRKAAESAASVPPHRRCHDGGSRRVPPEIIIDRTAGEALRLACGRQPRLSAISSGFSSFKLQQYYLRRWRI